MRSAGSIRARSSRGNPDKSGPGGKTPSLLDRPTSTSTSTTPTSLAQTLSDGFTPGFDSLGGAMGEVIDDETSQWTDEDRRRWRRIC